MKKTKVKIKTYTTLLTRLLPFVLTVIMVGISSTGYCRNIDVMGFVLESSNPNNNIEVLDANGLPCAMLMVVIPVKAEFEGNIVTTSCEPMTYQVEGTYDDGRVETSKVEMNRHLIFLSDGSKFIRVKVPGYDPTLVVFKDYDIDRLKSNSVYSLYLSSITDEITKDKRIEFITSEALDKYYNNDYLAAVPLLREAAEAGNEEVLFVLGLCYENGTGVLQDYKRAVDYYKQAADKGHTTAMLNLGNCYLFGQGVFEDETEAVRFYQESAKLGNIDAIYNLGVCYEYGMGVPQDFSQASSWYAKAAEKGSTGAQKKYEQLEKYIGK